jgi:ATP-dependent HslUV protease subunit HslV
MSTLVVVRKKGIACMSADTLTCFGNLKQLSHYERDPSKILKVGDSYFGIAGSTAHRLVLESAMSNPVTAPQLSTRMEIFEWFRGLHPRLKEEYYLSPKEGEKDPYESSQMDLLIANRHGVFGVWSLREVLEFERFWAIGSGSDFALGAMYTAYSMDTTARDVAEVGLKAALEFDDGSAGPITTVTVKLNAGEAA